MGKSSTIFLIASIIVVAVVFVFKRPDADNIMKPGQPSLFEQNTAQKVSRIQFQQGSETLELTSSKRRWYMTSHENYPADSAKVKAFLRSFFSIAIAQQVSSNPAQYKEFGLTDQAIRKGTLLITLSDASGSELGKLYVGESPRGPGGSSFISGRKGQYVRKEGRQGVFLIDQPIRVKTAFLDWYDPMVVNVSNSKVEKVEYYRLSGRSSSLQYRLKRVWKQGAGRKKSDSAEWLLEKTGYRKNNSGVAQVTSALSNVRTDELLAKGSKRAARLTFDRRTRFHLTNGLIYDVLSAVSASRTYITLAVSYDRNSRNQAKAKRAATVLSRRYKNWVYELPNSAGKKFRQDEDLVATKIDTKKLEREAAEARAAAEAERLRKKREEERAARKAREEAERQATLEAERQAKLEAERKAREEAERKAKEEAERKAREEAARKAKVEADRKAKLEAERKAKAEAERKAKLAAERQAKAEAERKAKAEAAKKAKLEAERKAKAEAERKSKLAAERKAKLEAERKAKAEAERKAKLAEAERKAKREAQRKARAEAERKAQLAAERKAKLEARRKARLEAERKALDAAKQAAALQAAKEAAALKAAKEAAALRDAKRRFQGE